MFHERGSALHAPREHEVMWCVPHGGAGASVHTTTPNTTPQVSEVVMVPNDKVGRLIGRAGATITQLQARTNTRIKVCPGQLDGEGVG